MCPLLTSWAFLEFDPLYFGPVVFGGRNNIWLCKGSSGTIEEVFLSLFPSQKGPNWPFDLTIKVKSNGFLETPESSDFFCLCVLAGFEFVQELPTPRFQFGGRTGNVVTALIFKRVH